MRFLDALPITIYRVDVVDHYRVLLVGTDLDIIVIINPIVSNLLCNNKLIVIAFLLC
jgi:hypothetical protein